MSTLTIPFPAFSPGTVIASSQMNANFAAITTLVNVTGFDSSNFTPGSLGHVALAPNAVQKDIINTNVFDQVTILGGNNVSAHVAGAATAALLSPILLPPGLLMSYVGATAPAGWLLCDGTSYTRTGATAALFAIIGTAYGTVDVNHFNVPDLRGRFARGWDHGAGNDPDAGARVVDPNHAGSATGDNLGSFQSNATATNGILINTLTFTGNSNLSAGGNTNILIDSSQAGGTGSTRAVLNGGNETRPLNIYVNYIIKV